MKRLIFVFISIFVLFNSIFAASFKKCAAVSNYFAISEDGYIVSAAYKFSISQNEGKNFISVSDINVNLSGVGMVNTCVMVNSYEQACFSNLPNSTTFSTDNSTISIATIFNETISGEHFVFIGGGIIDEGSFSDVMGQQYTTDRPCISYPGTKDLSYNITSCCTSFTTTLPESSINAPACSKFKSRSTIYDVSNNYKIIATSKVNYIYAKQTLYANVTFSSDSSLHVQLAANMDNDCSAFNGEIGQCSFDGPPSENGIIILRIESFTADLGLPDFFVGRIIFRNNQTLMEEGIPFTKENDCFYFSQIVYQNLVVASSFCCVFS